ncbi:chemotaxis protein CheW [mine drainage metagenome]|uniref:Chemotaxis protein CheW n=1 Tax=mine drainage metagenome TaxID=410659 RepID=A0A1J5S8F6_9ZZZZ
MTSETAMETATKDSREQEMRQFISFTIGAEEYGVDIMEIREIKGWTPATPLPNVPRHIRGVINLRGAVVPVFDLRMRFSGIMTEPSAHHVVMVVSMKERIMGVLVDAVADILTVAVTDVQPLPEFEHRNDAQFLSGLVNMDGRMVALLDLETLLLTDTMAQTAA